MGNRSSMIFVVVELKIIGTLSEAENIGTLVFVDGVVEEVNIVELVDGLDKFCRRFGAPVAFVRKSTSIGRIFAIKIVIAEGDEDRCDGAKIDEPSGETFELALALDGVERIDEIASDKDVIGTLGGGLRFDSGESLSVNGRAKMNVAHEQEFKLRFDGGLIEFVAGEIETVHLFRLYNESLCGGILILR